jgi:Flp pilus assembly protein TadD
MQQQQYAAAAKAFQTAVKLEPDKPDAHYRLARAYKELGNKAEALKEFARTRELQQKQDAAAAALPLSEVSPSQ